MSSDSGNEHDKQVERSVIGHVLHRSGTEFVLAWCHLQEFLPTPAAFTHRDTKLLYLAIEHSLINEQSSDATQVAMSANKLPFHEMMDVLMESQWQDESGKQRTQVKRHVGELTQSSVLDEIGGYAALHTWMGEILSDDQFRRYVQDVRSRWHLRKLQRVLAQAQTKCETVGADTHADEIRSQTMESLASFEGEVSLAQNLGALAKPLAQRKKEEAALPVSWGARLLDEQIPLSTLHLTTLAGLPGSMKTSLSMQAALATADKVKKPGAVLYCSLEMTAEEISAVAVGQKAHISARDILSGNISPDDREEIKSISARYELTQSLIIRDGRHDRTVAGVANAIRSHCQRYPDCRLVVIDYATKCKRRAGETVYDLVTDLYDTLCELRLRLGVCIMCLSQFSRGQDKNGKRKPSLNLLTGGSEIENASTSIVFIDSDNKESDPRNLSITVEKNRFGRVGHTVNAVGHVSDGQWIEADNKLSTPAQTKAAADRETKRRLDQPPENDEDLFA